MQMYVHYYERELMNEGDNPPIGIVLCADKSESVVKYLPFWNCVPIESGIINIHCRH